MKLACVIHRYGPDIAGGSEAHCRQLAERLAVSHDVTVLTSCAQDYVTWANVYTAGHSTLNGVHVIRFPVRRTRRLKVFAELSDEVFEGHAAADREEAWFRENGPDAPALLEHLRAHGHQFDLVLFWSYRYAPAYFGLPLVADRAVLVPTAEEDPAIGLNVLKDYFRWPAGFLFLTPEEEGLVGLRAGRALGRPSAIIGSGLDPAVAASGRTALDRVGVPPRFVLYLGRLDPNKGCRTMCHYFEAHLADGGTETTLVLAGPATMMLPRHPRIQPLGRVDDATRDALLAHADALIVPSPYESLSMSLLEGWNHRTPALVNAFCAVLQGQARRANGALWYRSAREFSAGLTWLMTDPRARTLGAQGRAYVEREYRWPVVIERVERLLEDVRGQSRART